MTYDNDRGGNSRKTMLIKKNRAWSKLFEVLVVLGGEELGKIVEHMMNLFTDVQWLNMKKNL